MKRDIYANIAKQTVEIGNAERYITDVGDEINLKEDITYMIHNSSILSTCSFRTLGPYKHLADSSILENRVLLHNRTTNEAIKFWIASSDKADVIALNFASAKNPGGGFLKGSTAQEESLARSSMLYRGLMANYTYYRTNRRELNNGLYTTMAIYTPKVPFIRDMSSSDEVLVRPIYADIITCPAVNKRVAAGYRVSDKDILDTMYERINLIFKTAFKSVKEFGYKAPVIVLGAFGCGCFKNKPEDVARVFNELIVLHSDTIKDLNITLDFSIPGGCNYSKFREFLNLY